MKEDLVTVSMADYLAPGFFVDSDAPQVRAFAAGVVGEQRDPAAQAALLFEAVRDRTWYDPFGISTEPAQYRARVVVNSTSNWCVPKAVLLAAGRPADQSGTGPEPRAGLPHPGRRASKNDHPDCARPSRFR